MTRRKQLLLAGAATLGLFWGAAGAMAQIDNEACLLLQARISNLDAELPELLSLVASQREELVQARDALNAAPQSVRGDPRSEARVRVLMAAEEFAATVARLERIATRIDSFETAALVICVASPEGSGNLAGAAATGQGQGSGQAAAAGAGSNVVENTVGQGGDEIIIRLEGAEGNVALPVPDDESDGWHISMRGTSVFTYPNGKVTESENSGITLIFGDDGTFLTGGWWTLGGCELSGGLRFSGDRFAAEFQGVDYGTSGRFAVRVEGKVLAASLDGKKSAPVSGTANIKRISGNGQTSWTGEFRPNGRAQTIARIDTAQYRSSYCGDGTR